MKTFYNCTKAQKVERWEQVIRVLRGLTRHQRTKHWDMAEYLDERSCGTVGCAAGYCSLDPWFRKRGVKAEAVKYDGKIDYWTYEGIDWNLFWGDGAEDIFQDRTQRSVGQVIREIKAHIKELRSE